MRCLTFLLIPLFAHFVLTTIITPQSDKNEVVVDPKNITVDNDKLNVDLIFRAMGVPQCMRKCIDPFINATSPLWTMKNVVGQARRVCSAHAKAISCLKHDQFCDVHGIFKVATSSVEYMCAKKFVLFERMESCLDPIVDGVMKECDEQCYARTNLTAFAQDSNIKFAATVGGNIFIVTDHIGPLCGSLQCTLPCVSQKLNKLCSLSGWLVLDMLMQPLDAAAILMEKQSQPVRDVISKKIDPRCRFAVNTTQLNRIRNGDFSAFQSK